MGSHSREKAPKNTTKYTFKWCLKTLTLCLVLQIFRGLLPQGYTFVFINSFFENYIFVLLCSLDFLFGDFPSVQCVPSTKPDQRNVASIPCLLGTPGGAEGMWWWRGHWRREHVHWPGSAPLGRTVKQRPRFEVGLSGLNRRAARGTWGHDRSLYIEPNTPITGYLPRHFSETPTYPSTCSAAPIQAMAGRQWPAPD